MTRAQRIQATLLEQFAPEGLEIVDQSSRHAGHVGADPVGETHFFVKVVAAAFEGLKPVDRQRKIYAALSEEMRSGLHALDLRALTPEEARQR